MKFFISLKKKFTFVLIILFSAALTPAMAKNGSIKMPEPTGVVYQSITVAISDRSVTLDWNTVSESKNSHFEVERSSDMTDFKTVAIILDGFATEGTGKKYSFKENASVIKKGKVAYYRLKQFDEYGNISYSKVFKVQ